MGFPLNIFDTLRLKTEIFLFCERLLTSGKSNSFQKNTFFQKWAALERYKNMRVFCFLMKPKNEFIHLYAQFLDSFIPT